MDGQSELGDFSGDEKMATNEAFNYYDYITDEGLHSPPVTMQNKPLMDPGDLLINRVPDHPLPVNLAGEAYLGGLRDIAIRLRAHKPSSERIQHILEKLPCRKLPCWGWILIFTTFLVISLSIFIAVFLVLFSDATSQLQAASLPSPPSAPPPGEPTATFIMECETPTGSCCNYLINDLCWLDDITMVIAQKIGQQVVKVTVDTGNKQCSFEVLDSGYEAWSVSCSPDGEHIYVIDHTNNRVRVYNRAGVGEVWMPQGLVGGLHTIAVNTHNIVIGVYRGPAYIYNINHEFLRKFEVGGELFGLQYIHLTSDNVLLATTGLDGHALIMHDLINTTSRSVGGYGTKKGKFIVTTGVCTAGDVIIVCDQSNRVSLFSLQGHFLHYLQFVGGGVVYPGRVSVSPGNSLLGVRSGGDPYNRVRVYSLIV